MKKTKINIISNLEKILHWLKSNEKDFNKNFINNTKNTISHYNEKNKKFYKIVKNFHDKKNTYKEKQKEITKTYKLILKKIKSFYKTNKIKLNDFNIKTKGLSLIDKIKILKTTFKKHQKELEKNEICKITEITEIEKESIKIEKESIKDQKKMQTAQRKRKEIKTKIKTEIKRTRYLIFAEYAGKQHKKTAFQKFYRKH